jgi:single-stranded DNA-binding protein
MSGIEAAFFGALSRDAESKTSKSDKPYLRINVRISDGPDAQWISVLAFDEKAIAAADNFVKGARVYVEGRLTLGEYTAGDGSKRASLSCMSWHCRLAQIGRNKTKRARHTAAPSIAGGVADFGSAAARTAPGQAHADLDDEIPF